MPEKLRRVAVLALVIIVALELSLRFYIFGLDALSYKKMNSHLLLMDSGLVQPAANTDIYYELRPNLDSLFRGKRLVSNSRGLPDKEYTIEKPDAVYRIAVAGSSWTMATGVEPEQAYHSILEERLNEIYTPKKFEVINFALEHYGLSEIVASIRYKALEYDPDMIIVSITSATPAILWEKQKAPFKPTDTVPPFWQSYLYSTVANLVGLKAYARSKRPNVDLEQGGYPRQIRRALEEIGELAPGKNIEVVIIFPTAYEYQESQINAAGNVASKEGFRLFYMNLEKLAADANSNEGLTTGRIDRHPSPAAHKLIAEKLLSEVWGQ
ncbi:MAG: hypothetical protein P8Y61_01140 [Gammaproteobacteria bacterium]